MHHCLSRIFSHLPLLCHARSLSLEVACAQCDYGARCETSSSHPSFAELRKSDRATCRCRGAIVESCNTNQYRILNTERDATRGSGGKGAAHEWDQPGPRRSRAEEENRLHLRHVQSQPQMSRLAFVLASRHEAAGRIWANITPSPSPPRRPDSGLSLARDLRLRYSASADWAFACRAGRCDLALIEPGSRWQCGGIKLCSNVARASAGC